MPVAVVCGRGSALEPSLSTLKKKSGEDLHIVACLSALPTLAAHGIRPRYAVAYDAGAESVNHIIGVDTTEIPLITMTTIEHELLCRWQGRIYMFNQFHPGFEFFQIGLRALYPQFDSYFNSGCVGNMALVIADVIGYEPIYLLGIEYPTTVGETYIPHTWKRGDDGKWYREESEAKTVTDKMAAVHERYREYLLATYFGVKAEPEPKLKPEKEGQPALTQREKDMYGIYYTRLPQWHRNAAQNFAMIEAERKEPKRIHTVHLLSELYSTVKRDTEKPPEVINLSPAASFADQVPTQRIEDI